MNLRQRILLGFGVTLAVMAVVVVWAIANLVGLGKATDAVLQENYRSILAAEHMIGAIERQDSATLLVVLGYEAEGLAQFRTNESVFLQWLGRAKDNITIEGEADILDGIESGYAEYLLAFHRLSDPGQTEPAATGSIYHKAVLPIFTRVRDSATRLRELNQQTMFDASQRAAAMAWRATWSTALVALFCLVLGFAFSFLLSKRLVQPILDMMAATETLASGNYDVHLPANQPGDELSRLAASFNAMAKTLGDYHQLNVDQIIAEKRKSDAVLQNIEDAVIVVDKELRVTTLNYLACRILDTGQNEAIGKHFLEVLPDETLYGLVKEATETGVRPALEEANSVYTRGSGEQVKHYQFSITPVGSRAGKLFGVVLLLRDITRLKELDRLKSEFVMTASHELKTPLQSLGMSIDLLREATSDTTPPANLELLAAAHEEVQRLKALVKDLLDLSRIEAGHVNLELTRVTASFLAEKARSLLAAQAEARQVELTVAIPTEIPELQVDPTKITWVLTNLIANALRYVDPGGHVAISARHGGDRVYLSVADDGTGIPVEHQSRIFDKFVQVESARSVGGSGLGLAICREIVRAHRGAIWVESEPGEGSTFTFSLPVAAETREIPYEPAKNPDRR